MWRIFETGFWLNYLPLLRHWMFWKKPPNFILQKLETFILCASSTFFFSLVFNIDELTMSSKTLTPENKSKWKATLDGLYLPFNPVILLLFPIQAVTRWLEICGIYCNWQFNRRVLSFLQYFGLMAEGFWGGKFLWIIDLHCEFQWTEFNLNCN